ncbi:MAG TPA: GNAT family N-acetyltransferase, partial [Candidatus Saccharimonadales bacterium]
MTTAEDDTQYWNLQQRNVRHIEANGDVVDETPVDTTIRRLSKNRTRFSIMLGDELIGMIEYRLGDDPASREAEIGILLSEDQTRHGYALASLNALTSAMESLGLSRIFAEVVPGNEASLRLFRRPETNFVESPYLGGEPNDQVHVFTYMPRSLSGGGI